MFASARGRALNLLHLFFSLGALGSPFVVGRLVESGVPWQAVVLGTALAALPLAILFAVIEMPSGRHATERGHAASAGAQRLALDPLLLVLALAIACYVASEVGVSNWLVRFLASAPLGIATTALTLFLGGPDAGSTDLGAGWSTGSITQASRRCRPWSWPRSLVGAVIVPSLPLSVALFTVAGFVSGPIYPLIVAIGGERFPGRSAAVGGFLSGTAVIGGVFYPPVMGFLSVTVGLPVAMIGTAMLALACGVVLFMTGERRR